MRLDIAGVPGIKLAVNQRVEQNLEFGAVHSVIPEAVAEPGFAVDASAVFHAERSMARARASRDMTVPTGTPVTSAISRYERSLISRSTIASRNGAGSSATSRRMVALSCCRNMTFSGEACGSCHIGISSANDSSCEYSVGNSSLLRRANSALQTFRNI